MESWGKDVVVGGGGSLSVVEGGEAVVVVVVVGGERRTGPASEAMMWAACSWVPGPAAYLLDGPRERPG